MSPAGVSLPGTGHCYHLHSLYFKPQWILLGTLPLCHATMKSGVSYRPFTLWDRGFLLKTLYFVTADTGLVSSADPIHHGIGDWCLLQTLYTVAQWTMESPADPIHCGTVDTGVSCRPSTWCHSGHIGVSWKAYTLWHSGQWCLLQTQYIVAQWTLESTADPIHCGTVDTRVSCRPSESHHITSMCIHAAAEYLLVTSVKGERLLLFW